MLERLLIGLIIFVLTACTPVDNKFYFDAWEYQAFDIQDFEKRGCDKEVAIIDRLTLEYQSDPYDKDYSKLNCSAIYMDKQKNMYIIFDVHYVDDLQVGFKFNKSHVLIENFLVSEFY